MQLLSQEKLFVGSDRIFSRWVVKELPTQESCFEFMVWMCGLGFLDRIECLTYSTQDIMEQHCRFTLKYSFSSSFRQLQRSNIAAIGLFTELDCDPVFVGVTFLDDDDGNYLTITASEETMKYITDQITDKLVSV